MKPFHVGVLVLGAAIVGALAVKMTQPPPIPAALTVPAAPALIAASVKPTPVPAAPQPLQAPAPQTAPSATTPATAPSPVYLEPAKPVIRKNKPIRVAVVKPTQWAPQPYQPPVQVPEPQPQQRTETLPAPVPSAPVPDPQPVQSAAVPEPAFEPSPVPTTQPAPRQVTLRTGITIPVRIDESLSSARSVAGDTFNASLAEPLVIDGLVIAERGAHVTGRILDSQGGGRVSGTAVLGLALTGLHTSDGQRIAINTEPWTRQADTSHREDAEKIGGGAALGAIIGAIAGGGKGAAIGAGIGGGAGAGAVIATRGKPVNVPTETVIRFRLASRVTITERQ